ncbi:hypothetical protein GCM10009544_16940 [Streptomyces stramineus]|uniref:Uncharacterized protein n=1 Tax=Streptomyces stramineus TaxID=173861 RepID=A0ABN0ZPK8_9ACTN
MVRWGQGWPAGTSSTRGKTNGVAPDLTVSMKSVGYDSITVDYERELAQFDGKDHRPLRT